MGYLELQQQSQARLIETEKTAERTDQSAISPGPPLPQRGARQPAWSTSLPLSRSLNGSRFVVQPTWRSPGGSPHRLRAYRVQRGASLRGRLVLVSIRFTLLPPARNCATQEVVNAIARET